MKYGDECPDAQVTEVACVALTLKRNGRQRLPSVLILSECDIEKAGDEEEVERKCEGVRELDLSRNKLKEWKEVSQSPLMLWSGGGGGWVKLYLPGLMTDLNLSLFFLCLNIQSVFIGFVIRSLGALSSLCSLL